MDIDKVAIIECWLRICQTFKTHSALKTDYTPYLTLFHADISLAFSLSISSGSPVVSLLGSGVCGSRRPKLPCRSGGCCLRLSTSSSCITPPTYCAALGEMEFIPLSLQSWTLLLLIATQNWQRKDKTVRDPVNYWLLLSSHSSLQALLHSAWNSLTYRIALNIFSCLYLFLNWIQANISFFFLHIITSPFFTI